MPRGVYDRSKSRGKKAGAAPEKVTKRKYTKRAAQAEPSTGSGGGDVLMIFQLLVNLQGTFNAQGPTGKEFAERNAKRLDAIAEQLWPSIEPAAQDANTEIDEAQPPRRNSKGSNQAPAPFAPPAVPHA